MCYRSGTSGPSISLQQANTKTAAQHQRWPSPNLCIVITWLPFAESLIPCISVWWALLAHPWKYTTHVTTLLLTRRQEPFYQQIKYIKEHGLTFIYLKKCVHEMGESPLILLILHPVCWPL